MRKLSTLLMFVILISLLYSCGEDQSENSDGDRDRDVNDQAESIPDGDNESAYGDADKESEDGDIEVAELSEDEAVENEAEIDDTDNDAYENDTDNSDGDGTVDGDADCEVEQEQDNSEAGHTITLDEFPFETTTIVPCEGMSEDFMADSSHYDIWGDGQGNIFLTGIAIESDVIKSYLMKYDESADTLTCLQTFDFNAMPALCGRLIEGQPEVWVFTGSKIGKFYNGVWEEQVEVPNIPEQSFESPGMKVSAGGTLTMWAGWGWYFFDLDTRVLTEKEKCPGMENNPLLYGDWVGENFYMPGGCTVYSIDPQQMTCETAFTIAECSAASNGWLYAYGSVDNELWLAQINDIETPAAEWIPRYFYQYNVLEDTYQIVEKEGFRSSNYPSPGSGASYQQALPGMAGWPFVLASASKGWDFYDNYIFSFAITVFASDDTAYRSPAISIGLPGMGLPALPILRSRTWRHDNRLWVLSFKTVRFTWTETEP